MLHGHTKIELKNEKTGEIQVVEKDNMITNIFQHQFNPITSLYGASVVNSEYFPLNDKGMGGIILFQNELDENADNINIFHDDRNPVIGYASNDVNSGTDIKRGSRNLTESSKLDNGYKFVWDFTTAQANGQISALGLTHAGTGKDPNGTQILGSNINVNLTSDIVKNIVDYGVDYDWTNSIITCIQTMSATSLKVTKYKFDIGMIPINITSTIFNCVKLSEETINISSSIQAGTKWINNPNDNYYYGFYGSLSDSTGNIYLYRIQKSDYSLDTNFSKTINITKRWYVNMNMKPVIMDDYLYFSTSPSVIKLNMKDISDITYGSTFVPTLSFVSHNDIIHAGVNFINKNLTVSKRRTNTDDSRVCFLASSSAEREQVFVRNDGVAVYFIYYNYYSTYKCGIGNLRDYLATINNLDSPVIKTSEQSMKITYTITEE